LEYKSKNLGISKEKFQLDFKAGIFKSAFIAATALKAPGIGYTAI